MNSYPIEEDNAAGFAFWLRFWRRTVAALQIGGGLFGLYNVMFGQLLGPSRLLFLLAFVLFTASVWGGILLALDKPGGLVISLLIQFLQVPQIVTASALYSFVCGVQLVLGLRLSGVATDAGGPETGLSYYFPARFFLFINPPPSAVPQAAYTGLNVVAVLAIICLLIIRSAQRRLLAPNVEPPAEGVWPPAPGL